MDKTVIDGNKLVDLRRLRELLEGWEGYAPTTRAFRRLIAERKIPFVRVGGRILFRPEEVRRALYRKQEVIAA